MKLTDLIGRSLPFFHIRIGTPGSPERIRELSRRLNIAFPPDYELVLSTYGSLYVELKYGEDDPICVYGFAGSGKTSVLDVEKAASSNHLFTHGLGIDDSCKGEIEPKFLIAARSEADEKAITAALRQSAGLVPILAIDEGHLSRGPQEMDKAWVLTRKGSLLDIYKMRLENPRVPFIMMLGTLIQGSVERALSAEGVDKDIVAAMAVFTNELKDWLE